MKNLFGILLTLFGTVEIVASIAVEWLSYPIMKHIGSLADADRIGSAFLWLVLLLFTWAIGIGMFFMGAMFGKYGIDELSENRNAKKEKEEE